MSYRIVLLKHLFICAYYAKFFLSSGGVIRDLSLKTVLSFFTGAEEIPTTGFGEAPSLAFSHSDSPFPTASTCATQLVLPTKNKDQTSFNDKMIYGLLNHGGFGKP